MFPKCGSVVVSTLLFVVLMLSSCLREDDFYEGNDIQLEFSTDTLRFDTVFTTQGSATRTIKVYNPLQRSVRIKSIRLRDQDGSFFRMNVDGISGRDIGNVEILGGDSIYVFVEVTIDPDQPASLSPFVISDAIEFQTNGVQQRIVLEAWGQNAIYIPNNVNSKGVARLTCDNLEVVWNDSRPYVVFGVLLVDSCTLRIQEGVRVHFHGGVVQNAGGVYTDGFIYTQSDGVLRVEGSPASPVVFRTDRLEEGFNQLPGQWGGIRLGPNSKGHSFRHARIFNSVVGILVDSSATLDIAYSEIGYTSGSGLVSYAGDIRADNVLIHDNGRQGVQLLLGGDHRFRYCTLANFNNTAEALQASNIYCLDPLCSESYRLPLRMRWTNCIVTGNQKDEITLIDASSGAAGWFDYLFSHSVVRVDELLDSDQWPEFLDNCTDCLRFQIGDKLFVDQNMDDYHLDSLSIARDKAIPIPELPDDLNGVLRDPVVPDVGCYERVD